MAAITPDGGAAAVGDDASDSISLPSGPTPSTGEEARSRIAEFAQTVSTYRSHIATVKVGGHPPHRPAAVTLAALHWALLLAVLDGGTAIRSKDFVSAHAAACA